MTYQNLHVQEVKVIPWGGNPHETPALQSDQKKRGTDQEEVLEEGFDAGRRPER